MSLDKAIHYGKEHRKPYYRAPRFSLSCRPHGNCSWCRSNRFHNNLVRMLVADETGEGLYPIKGRKINLRKLV